MPRRFVLGRPVAQLAGIDAWRTALSVVLGLAEGRVRGGRRESRHVGRTIGASRMGESPATGPPVRRSARRAAPIASIAVSVLLLSALALAVARLLRRPGRPKPFLGADGRPFPGSISEKIRVPINGVEQGMFIKSRGRTAIPCCSTSMAACPTTSSPSATPPVSRSTSPWSWWEQRGSGLSYSAGHSTGDREPGATGVRHAGGDRLPSQALRPGEDLPHGAFRGDLHRHAGGCAGPGAVPRLHRRGSDVASARVRAAGVRLHAPSGSRRTATRRWRASSKQRRSRDAVPLPDAYQLGARRRDARSGHRHDARHEVDRHRAAAAVSAKPRVHAGREDRHVARQDLLRQPPVEHGAGHGPDEEGDAARDPRLLPARRYTTTRSRTRWRSPTSSSWTRQ